MKNFELNNEGETWKEIIPFNFTEEQLAFLQAPTTEENKEEKNLLIQEVNNASRVNVTKSVRDLLDAKYQSEKLKIANLTPESDYRLIKAIFNEFEGKYAGVIYYNMDELYYSHNFKIED